MRAASGEGPAVRFVPLGRGAARVVAAWAARGRARRPVVLVLPGLLQPPGSLFGWLYELARAGAVAATLESMPALDWSGAGTLAQALDRLVATLVDRARGALEVLAGLEVVQPERAGVVGVSAGGWAALRLAEGPPPVPHGVRIRAVAAVLSGPGWRRIPDGAREVLRDLGVRAWPGEGPEEVDPERCPRLHPGDAAERAGRLAECAVLLVAGGKDPVVDPAEVKAFYRELAQRRPEEPERTQLVLYPGLDHRLTPPLQGRVGSWMLWMLGAGGPGR